jgi:hypothetical protein
MRNRCEGVNPEKVRRGGGRWYTCARRQQCDTRLGERGVSTRGPGLIESGDKEQAVTMEILMGCEGARSPASSRSNKERDASIRKSERSIVPMKPGNAGGGKGPRYRDSELTGNMPRHCADYAHEH